MPSVLNVNPLARGQRVPLPETFAGKIPLFKAEAAPLLQAPGKASLLQGVKLWVRLRCTQQSLALQRC
jgi:hypothetical protein